MAMVSDPQLYSILFGLTEPILIIKLQNIIMLILLLYHLSCQSAAVISALAYTTFQQPQVEIKPL